MFASHQSQSSLPSLRPFLSFLYSSLFFSEDCGLFSVTAVSQPFAYQLLPHSFGRDGGCTPQPLPTCPPKPFPALLTVIQLSCFHAITKCKFHNSFLLIFIHHWWGGVGGATGSFLNYYFKSPGIPTGFNSLPIALCGTANPGCMSLPVTSHQSPVTDLPHLAGGAQLGVN